MTKPDTEACSYLTGLSSAFADGTRPTIDAARCGGDTFPVDFARLTDQWNKCLDAAKVINSRYYDDWNRQGGVLTVIAPATRDAALSELRAVWMTLVRNYVADTLDANRAAWDCPFCGVPVPREHVWDADRCPSCMTILSSNDAGTDWEL
ncbi:hypothetical protein [Mycobacteroides abscessus]|uniref:hypothetical protein n=1 Tax=Mycobacteroides abscessus TaxID=36809 RepID=UPI00025885CC|nr:hypothetical protein [Mycobacteroides abscessus]EIC62296.1 hypothetical protein S7W_24226 [Mycobacteroides abscessus M94]SKZ50075.1 Uncharacterised protein [Mycobacteroides abscessus subsp. abscessus]